MRAIVETTYVDFPSDPRLVAVALRFGVAPNALLGHGGEAWVYALDDERVLRVLHDGGGKADVLRRLALVEELALSQPVCRLPEVLLSLIHIFERQNCSVRKFIAGHGGQRPTDRQRSELRLSLEEREEISRGLAAGLSIRSIAEELDRSPSTVCREVNANGGRRKYRALQADRDAERRALRPKRAKLSQCRRLRTTVERKLEARWSPQQISAWLAETYPDDPEMQVSHETIYQSLFVQGRGCLLYTSRCV